VQINEYMIEYQTNIVNPNELFP